MPSHPDRVRRNYHTIYIGETVNPQNFEQIIYIQISRLKIATAMTRREIEHIVFRTIHNGILEQYRS